MKKERIEEIVKDPNTWECGQSMKYYLDNQDDVWAIDQNGNEFLVTKRGLIPAKKGSVDIMWGGIAESEVAGYLK